MKYELKPLTLSQRIECNDIQAEMNATTGTVVVRDLFAQRVKYLRYGLKSLNGIELTSDNFDEEVNKLTNTKIKTVSDKIAEETNISKKK